MNKYRFLLLVFCILPFAGKAQPLNNFSQFSLENGLRVAFSPGQGASTIIEVLELLNLDHEGGLPGIESIFFESQILQAKKNKHFNGLINDKLFELTAREHGFLLRCSNAHVETALQLIGLMLSNPQFEIATLRTLRDQHLEQLNKDCQDPKVVASNLRLSLNFNNYPYGKLASTASYEAITIKHLQDYHQQNFSPSTTRLVIIGAPTEQQVNNWVQKSLGSWKEKDFYNSYIKKSKPPQNRGIHFAEVAHAKTASIVLTHPVRLRTYDAQHHTAALLEFIYQKQLDSLFQSKEIYTQFRLKPDKNLGQFFIEINFPSEKLEEILPTFLHWVENIGQDKFSEKQFSLYKKEWREQVLSEQAAIEGQLAYGRGILLSKMAAAYYKDTLSIHQLQASDIRSAVKIFIHPFQAYLIITGSASCKERLQQLFPDQKIQLHDCLGGFFNQIIPNNAKVDVNTVLEDYLIAIGGQSKTATISSISYTQTTQIDQLQLHKLYYKKAPNKLSVEQRLNKKLIKELKFNGSIAALSKNEKVSHLIGAPAKDIAYRSYIFPEQAALKGVFKPRLLGIEEIKGEQFYVVEFSITKIVKRRNYYSKKTGLKLKSVLLRKDSSSTEEYGNYQATKGILFPTDLTIINSAAKKTKLHVSNIVLNIDIPDANFEFKN